MDEQNMKYRKKSSSSSTSVARKRADHKHDYEKVIIKNLIGYEWGGRCSVCGRVKYSGYPFKNATDFMRPEYRNSPGFSPRYYLSNDEVHELFPDFRIYEEKNEEGWVEI